MFSSRGSRIESITKKQPLGRFCMFKLIGRGGRNTPYNSDELANLRFRFRPLNYSDEKRPLNRGHSSSGRGGRNRTDSRGFGDRWFTVNRHPFKFYGKCLKSSRHFTILLNFFVLGSLTALAAILAQN